MDHYSQPHEYHFAQDSIELLHWALDKATVPREKSLAVLDAGAGCGVLGKEWLLKRPEDHITLIEKQEVFQSHLEANFQNIQDDHYEILIKDLSELDKSHTFDVIIANPPYFFMDEGRLPQCHIRKNCRHVHEHDLITFFSHLRDYLKPSGFLFFCFRQEDWLYKIKDEWHEVAREKRNNYSFYYWKKTS